MVDWQENILAEELAGALSPEQPLVLAADPEEWSLAMQALAGEGGAIRWGRHGLIRRRSRDIHDSMNDVRQRIEQMPPAVMSLIPAARWLIDNFQLIYREIKRLNFSSAGDRPLPLLTKGPMRGQPRVYALASKMETLTQGQLSEESILLLVDAYQQVRPLTGRELQVLPEMLGLCLLEHLLRLTGGILSIIRAKAQADTFVRGRMAEEADSPDIAALFSRGIAARQRLSFHSHALYLLKGLELDEQELRRYIAFHFEDAKEIPTAADIFREEGRVESILESAVRTPISSLRDLNELDAEELFTQLSEVERVLSQDPAGVYARMDGASRAEYREAVGKLAMRLCKEETLVAETCVALAAEGQPDICQPHHVGSYLLTDGIRLLEQRLRGGRAQTRLTPRPMVRGPAYFLLVLALTGVVLALMYAVVRRGGAGAAAMLLALSLPLALGVGIKAANAVFTRVFPAKRLPAMDYSGGVPDQARTIVVMPVIMSSPAQGLAHLERLEKHYLANRQKNLYFALLADYADADEAVKPEDQALREALEGRVRELNVLWPAEPARFALFMRERRYNPSEDCFMCWERKRGKLEEFNRLLRGDDIRSTSFVVATMNTAFLTGIKYVITLDADSDLRLNDASRLVGIIHHPLNSVVIDPASGRVLAGYAIIQPQVVNRIGQAEDSLFTRIYAGKSGIANYSMAVSDIYQDLFQEGIFVGKGIYDAEAFRRLLGEEIPENRVLSHDLLESCYARTGFAAGAQIVESFPGSYASFIKRQHRWIRGDWQLLPWLFRSRLRFLSKWKILDDLRASLLPVTKVVLLFTNVLFMPGQWWLVPALLLVQPALDLLVLGWSIVAQWASGRGYVLLYRKLLETLALLVSRFFLELVFAPYEAYIALDAAIRMLYRLLYSKRRFLLWETAELSDKGAADSWPAYLRSMWVSLPLGAGLTAAALTSKGLPPCGLMYAAVGVLWVLAPFIAHALSLKREAACAALTPAQHDILRDVARRSWRFFRAFTSAENNFLIPDNYQAGRRPAIAAKTSPTNIGLQLLSMLSAYDMGFETLGSLLDMLEATWQTIQKLPVWNGHLYNWYNTRSLEVLSPRYVSTVDSGNYTAYLLTLRQGLTGLLTAQMQPAKQVEELRALLRAFGQEEAVPQKAGTYQELAGQLRTAAQRMQARGQKDTQPETEDLLRLSAHLLEEWTALGILQEAPGTALTLTALSQAGNERAHTYRERICRLVNEIDKAVKGTDFDKLFHHKRRLFSIGYNASNMAYDASCYDLIASEATLTSLLAIAKGDVQPRHWQALGRPQTIIRGRAAHVSWSGTMFEYLLNHLVLMQYRGSVFGDSALAAVTQQRIYARKHKAPWGISESQYYLFDINHNYQYRAFGVPKLRLQPIYQEMLVISPYSTMLALEQNTGQALKNLRQLRELGAYGEYGYYEALDFSVPDPVTLQRFRMVKSFMAHHQGMSLVAINNCLNQGIMRQRFHSAPIIRAAQSLLEESQQSLFAAPSRRGYTINFKPRETEQLVEPSVRYIRSTNLPVPAANYLSNGRYSVLLTADGDGFSRLDDIMLYRWRPDIYAHTGFYLYVRDTVQGSYWSAAHHPVQAPAERYQVGFHTHQTEFVRQDAGIATTMVVTLFPDANMEIRRLKLRNTSPRERSLEVSSYMELVVDTYAAEASHPAFQRMFLQMEYLPGERMLLATRNRGGMERPVGMQALYVDSPLLGEVEVETSRERFIGRNGTLRAPLAMSGNSRFSGSTTYTGDPIMSLRASLRLEPGEEAEFTFLAGLQPSREAALAAAGFVATPYLVNDALARFRQQSLLEYKYIGVSANRQRVYQSIIRQLYYPHRYLRGGLDRVDKNRLGQSGLWKFGISGDNPLMLLNVDSPSQAGLVRDVLKAAEYLGLNGIRADLAIIAQGNYGYLSDLSHMLSSLTSSLRVGENARERMGIFILHSYDLSPEEMDLLYTVARVVFSSDTGIYFRKQREGSNDA